MRPLEPEGLDDQVDRIALFILRGGGNLANEKRTDSLSRKCIIHDSSTLGMFNTLNFGSTFPAACGNHV